MEPLFLVSHHTIDPTVMILGGLLFWAPGLIWTYALTPGMGWAYRVPLSIVAAFTLQPAVMMFLNLVLSMPITLATTSYLSATMVAGGAYYIVRREPKLWDPFYED